MLELRDEARERQRASISFRDFAAQDHSVDALEPEVLQHARVFPDLEIRAPLGGQVLEDVDHVAQNRFACYHGSASNLSQTVLAITSSPWRPVQVASRVSRSSGRIRA